MKESSFEKPKTEGEEREGSPEEKKKELEKEILKPLIEKMQKFLDFKRDIFNTFAQDASLNYKANTSFFIDYKTGDIHSDVRWFQERFEKKEIEEMIEWAHYHELAHFLEYAQDPEAVLENFSYLKEKSKGLSPKVLEIWQKKAGGKLPDYLERKIKIPKDKERKEFEEISVGEYLAQNVVYQALDRFYGSFDDINANSLIKRRVFKFAEGSRGDKLVRKLYRERLFPTTDYSQKPLHLHLLNPYLREEMLPEEKVKISPEVEKIRKNLRYLDEDISEISTFNEFFIKKKSPKQRYKYLKAILEPIYLDLLFSDLKKADIPPPPKEKEGEGGEGIPLPFEKDYQDYKENSPDQQFDEKDIENWVKKKKEEKEKEEEERKRKEEEEKKPISEKMKEIEEKRDREWCEKNGVDYKFYQKVKKIENEIEPYLDELSKFWQKIVFGYTTEREMAWEGWYKIGLKPDIRKIIREWPKIEKGDVSEVKIMEKRAAKEKLVHKPENIRVRLVCDVSESMSEGNKLEILRRVVVLLGRSLQEFNHYLAQVREITGTKLISDLEIWKFESDCRRIKPLAGDDYRERDFNKEKVDFINSIGFLFETGDSTADHLPLQKIDQEISPEDIERIKEEKLMEIVIEITDGGSNEANLTKQAKDKLKEKGIIAKAFQISVPSEFEIKAFKTAWEDDGDGERVPDAPQVLPALIKLLEKYLKKVKL